MSVYNLALLLKKLSGHKRGPGVCVNSKKKRISHTHTPGHTHIHSQVRSVLIPELNSQQVETRAKAFAATVWANVHVFMCVYVIPIPASCDLPYGQSSWLLPLKAKLKGSKHWETRISLLQLPSLVTVNETQKVQDKITVTYFYSHLLYQTL